MGELSKLLPSTSGQHGQPKFFSNGNFFVFFKYFLQKNEQTFFISVWNILYDTVLGFLCAKDKKFWNLMRRLEFFENGQKWPVPRSCRWNQPSVASELTFLKEFPLWFIDIQKYTLYVGFFPELIISAILSFQSFAGCYFAIVDFFFLIYLY